MDLTIYVDFDGEWVLEGEKWVYKAAKNDFFCAPTEISYLQLLDMLYEILLVDQSAYDLKLEATLTCPGSRPVTLSSDRHISHLIDIGKKKNISLCVTPVSKISSKASSSCVEANTKTGSHENDDDDRVVNLPDDNPPSPVTNRTDSRFTNEDLQRWSPNHGSSLTGSSVDLFVGKIFKNQKEMKTFVSIFAMKNKFEFRVYKATPELWFVKCIGEKCSWKLRGKLIKESAPMFKIVVFVRAHTCSLEDRQTDHKSAIPWVVGHIMKDKFSSPDLKYTPKDLQEDMKKQFGIDMSYEKAWRCKEKAVGYAMGTSEDSYSKLPRYLYMLEKKNPGTVTDFHCKNGHFKYCFFAFGACLRGFKSVRPVLCVDSTFIKSKYRGHLLTAIALDGDGQMFPIAFGIVDSENLGSWMYFMTKLKEAIGSVENLAFVSDTENNIVHALENIFPDAYHGACYNHMIMNIRAKFHCEANILHVFNAAFTFQRSEFEQNFNVIRANYPLIAEYLDDIGFQKWARCFFPGIRYNIMTSNFEESLNKIVSVAKTFPVTSMVEFIRFTLQQWFYDRRTAAESNQSTLTPLMEQEIQANCDMAQRLTINCRSEHEFQVFDLEGNTEVNLIARECTCGVFQNTGIPCVHVAAVCFKRSIDIYSLCSPFYTVDSLKSAYESVVYPCGDERDWTLPEELKNIQVGVPAEKRSIGRPKKDKEGRSKIKRLPSQNEQVVVKKKCKKCGVLGHYQRTCNSSG